MKLSDSELNYRKYHRSGCQAYVKIPKNAIFMNSGSTVKHEMAKALGAYMVNKYGEVKFNKKIIDLLEELQIVVKEELKDFPKNGRDFITEAVMNKNSRRRVDLVELDRNVRYEFETDHKVQKVEEEEGLTITIYL